jgi:hypothetical protein
MNLGARNLAVRTVPLALKIFPGNLSCSIRGLQLRQKVAHCYREALRIRFFATLGSLHDYYS